MFDKIKIIIVDDHILFAELLAEKLENILVNVSKIRAFQSIDQTPIEELSTSQLLILDINLNGESSLESITLIKSYSPKIKILMLSSEADFFSINKASLKGADGFVNKSTNLQDLKKAIEIVLSGKKYFENLKNSEVLKEQIYVNNKIFHITDKEIEIIKMLSDGNNTSSISEKLFISIRTVETHKKNIFKKLGVSNVLELLVKAEKQGYITK